MRRTSILLSPILFAALAHTIFACSGSDPTIDGIAPAATPPDDKVDGGRGPSGGGTEAGLPEAGPRPFVPSRRFASAATTWDLPKDVVFPAQYVFRRGQTWDVFDIDGDGKPDLVFSADQNNHVFGTPAAPEWRVYKNLGGKLASTPTAWPVPAERFSFLRQECAGVIDVDGDELPDLVDFCELTGAVAKPWGAASGTPHWKVHKNTKTGFASAPITWSLPAEVPQAGAYVGGLTGTEQPVVYIQQWAALDVDGDGKLDLLAPAAKSSWKIHRATPSGFSATPAPWSVPSPGSDPQNDYSFGGLSGGLWAAVDLDGDKNLDFVVTGKRIGSARLAFTTTKKTPYWKLHRGGPSGFASGSLQWWVPDGAEHLVDSDNFGSKSATFDIDGDGKPDLVYFGGRSSVYNTSDGKGPHWRVFLNAADRFGQGKSGTASPPGDPGPIAASANVHEWLLPPSLAKIGTSPLNGRDGDAWATLDVDGDGRLDLVVMADATGGVPGGASAPRWDVYPGTP